MIYCLIFKTLKLFKIFMKNSDVYTALNKISTENS